MRVFDYSYIFIDNADTYATTKNGALSISMHQIYIVEVHLLYLVI